MCNNKHFNLLYNRKIYIFLFFFYSWNIICWKWCNKENCFSVNHYIYTYTYIYFNITFIPYSMFINHMIRVIPQNHNICELWICGQKIFHTLGYRIYYTLPPFSIQIFFFIKFQTHRKTHLILQWNYSLCGLTAMFNFLFAINNIKIENSSFFFILEKHYSWKQCERIKYFPVYSRILIFTSWFKGDDSSELMNICNT